MPNLQEVGKSLASVGSLLKGKFAKAGLTIVFVGSLFTAIGVVSSAWDSWGLPRFAYASEVHTLSEQMKKLVEDGKTTRELLYYARKDSLEKELTRLQTRLSKEPTNLDLRQRITSTKSQLQIIHKELGLRYD